MRVVLYKEALTTLVIIIFEFWFVFSTLRKHDMGRHRERLNLLLSAMMIHKVSTQLSGQLILVSAESSLTQH